MCVNKSEFTLWSISSSTGKLSATTCAFNIDGKENVKMTGDSMKMLVLSLPFMVCDLRYTKSIHSLSSLFMKFSMRKLCLYYV